MTNIPLTTTNLETLENYFMANVPEGLLVKRMDDDFDGRFDIWLSSLTDEQIADILGL